jgi:hypothetical protein
MKKLNKINENNIWSIRQNHPELVVQDCKEEFDLNEEDCKKLRFILLKRGINKWLLARRKMIKLKHETKEIFKKSFDKYGPKNELVQKLQYIHSKLQNIAKLPRWVEWNSNYHSKMRNNEKEIKIKGRKC